MVAKQATSQVTTNSMLVLAASEKEILESAKEIRIRRSEENRANRIQKIVEISKGNSPLGQAAERYPVIYCDTLWR